MHRKKNPFKNGVKLAWLLIALGMILGGVVGLTQNPPPLAAEGWTSKYNSEKAIVISDQNNDGMLDLFMWNNPIDPFDSTGNYDENDPSMNTASCRIISGSDGALIREEYYDNETYGVLFLDYNGFFTGTYISGDFVVLPLAIAKNISAMDNLNERVHIQTYSLYKIDLTDLSISEPHNIFENGWDSEQVFTNDSYEDTEQALRDFSPRIYHLVNQSINTPNSIYNGEVLVITNYFNLLNETTQILDSNVRRFSFINPITLETLSVIEWENNPLTNATNVDIVTDFCDGPVTDLNLGSKMPYIYAYEIYDGAQDEKNISFSITSIDELNNNTAEINWIVKNETFSKFSTLSNFDDIGYDFKFNLNYKNLEMPIIIPTGISILHRSKTASSNPIPEEERAIFNNQLSSNVEIKGLLQWSTESTIFQYFSSRLKCYNIETPLSPIETYSLASIVEVEGETIDYLDVSDEIPIDDTYGVCVDIAPIKTSPSEIITNTSIAMIFSTQNFQKYLVGDIPYLSTYYSVIRLPLFAAGTYYTGDTYLITSPDFTQTLCWANLMSYNTEMSIRFDLDEDGITDIPIPGILLIDRKISDSGLEVPNAPFFAFTSKENLIVQDLYWEIQDNAKMKFLSDLNNDSVSDILLGQNIAAFVELNPEQLSDIEKILDDPESMVLFISGIIMLVVGLAIIIFLILKMKDASVIMENNDKKRLIIMIAITIGLIVVLFSILNGILDQSRSNTSTIIGVTPEYQALLGILKTSTTATFIFLCMLPITSGLFMLISPIISDGIVGFNQIFFAKKAGVEATMKKEELKDVDKIAHINYNILIVPPFGREQSSTGILSRVLSVLALSLSIGLTVFDYGTTLAGIEPISTITSVSDPNFGLYIRTIFRFLIIPGIISVPLFFWLVPTSWLLDDAGVLFYVKKLDSRKPEDVENVGGWFSNYLKGFLGISAIVSYVRFIIESPITSSVATQPGLSDVGGPILAFVFGYVIIAGLSIGLLAVVFHELSVPYNSLRLYNRLEDRKVIVSESKIEFTPGRKLDYETTIGGFLGRDVESLVDNSVESSEIPKESNDKDSFHTQNSR